MHPFEKVIEDFTPTVRKAFDSYLYGKIEGITPEDGNGQHADRLERLHWDLCADYAARPSKMVRPILVMLTAEALGADPRSALLTAVAAEYGQNWLLIHDDLEDGSIERRGSPALHLKYNPAMAINAGDAVQLIMWKVLRDNARVLGASKAHRVMDEFYRMLFRTVTGQTAELELVRSDRFDVWEEEYFYVADSKTGYYTIAGPMRLGALVAIDDPDRLENVIFPQLSEVGLRVGRAYQIVDDLLDLTSDFSGRKKQRGNDLYEGKRTLVLSHLMGVVSDEKKRRFEEILRKPRAEKTAAEVESIIREMHDHGSFDYAKKRAESFTSEALERLDAIRFFVNQDAVAKLRQGIEFSVRRRL